MTTINSIGTSLSGQSGSGAFSGTISPTFVTPVLGASSATSIAFSSISGIIGTTTNDNAAAGSVGEEVSSVVSYPGAACTSVVPQNVTSIELTAGDWDVSGFVGGSGNGSTQVIYLYGQATATSASIDISQSACSWGANTAYFDLAPMTATPRTTRFSLSTTTTIYLVGEMGFTVSTATLYGTIRARRVR